MSQKSLIQTTTRWIYTRCHCVPNGFKLKTPFCALLYPANVAENEGCKKFNKWLPASLTTTLNPNISWANAPTYGNFRQLKSLKVKSKTSAVKVSRVISRTEKKLPKCWRNNRGIVCLLQRTLVSKLFFSGKRVFELPRHSCSSRRFLFPRYIFKPSSCGAQPQSLFLYSLSATTNFCVIPFIRRTMETSHVLAKMHLYAHKAKFFTIGPSIGIFSFLRWPGSATRLGLCGRNRRFL